MMIKDIRNKIAILTSYPVFIEEAIATTTMPYVVVSQMSGVEDFDHEGTNLINEAVIEVVSWGISVPQTRGIAETIKTLLNYRTTSIRLITLENETDIKSGDKFGAVLGFYIRFIRTI